MLGSTILMAISMLRKNESFFNMREVFCTHFKLFNKCKTQYFVFYFLPLLFSIGLSFLYVAGDSFFSELSIVMSVILSMHMAILSILSSYTFSSIRVKRQREKGNKVIKETINSILFNSTLCLVMLLYNLVMIVIDEKTVSWILINKGVLKMVASGIAYYIFLVILLTLLLIMKQMSKLIEFNIYAIRGDNK